MQKKSLLVALFCGALCLVGCIKNEESASVAQVRIAKANELNSLADLNKAKAAAEAVYAQAELVVAQAEAELRKAQANLVNAQAETEKVRAELLKVRVALAEVEVDEEKVRLQMLEADLEQKLAEVEAAVAEAKAEKQKWINELEHQMAKAEIQAIRDAQATLKAQDELQKYILTQEGVKADSAKAAGAKYFAALREIQNLQLESIKTKAEKALVEAGALQIRDAIHYAIDQIDEEIAKKEALVEYLKEYQSMTPEEAEEALLEARTALNEAFNEYKAAVEVTSEAQKEFMTAIDKHSDFEHNWWNIVNALQKVEGVEMEMNNAYTVEVGDETLITRAGVIDLYEDDEDALPLPLISDEARKPQYARYPDIDVVANNQWKNKDHVVLTSYVIAPATIYYDNIQTVMDTVVARKEREVAGNIKFAEMVNDWWSDVFEASVEDNNEKIALHKKYIAARKDTVEKYENAYLAAVEDVQGAPAKIEEAWKEFQEYMLVKHPTLSRSLFINVYTTDTIYRAAKNDSLAKKTDLDTKKAALGENDTTGLRKAVKEAFEAYAKVEGNYNKVKDSLLTGHGPAKKLYDTLLAFTGEKPSALSPNPFGDYGSYNPKFAASEVTATPIPETFNIETPYAQHWKKGDVDAGSAQDSTLNALKAYEWAQENAYKVLIDSYRNRATAAQVTAANNLEDQWKNHATVNGAKETAAAAVITRINNSIKTAIGTTLDEATVAYNPDFFSGKIFQAAKFSTLAKPIPNVSEWDIYATYKATDKKWVDEQNKEARSAQVAVLNAVKKAKDQQTKVNEAEGLYTTAKGKAETAKGNYEEAQKKLIAAIDGIADWTKVDLSKKDIKDYLDKDGKDFYEAYVAAYDVKYDELWKAWFALQNAYGNYPDQIGMNRPGDNVPARFQNFGWMISNYNVDYEATVIDFWGQKVPVAAQLYGYTQDEDGKWVPNYTNSLKYQVEQAQNMIDKVLPEWISEYKKTEQGKVTTLKSNIDDAMAVVNAYKSKEAGYKAWLTERQTAETAVNEAKKAEFDAEMVKNDAQAAYDAIDAVANEGMWVYDPDGKIYKQVYHATAPKQNEPGKYEDGFTFITIQEEIERLEGNIEETSMFVASKVVPIIMSALFEDDDDDDDEVLVAGAEPSAVLVAEPVGYAYGFGYNNPFDNIAGLNFTKTVLQDALKYGKITLQVVLEAYDAEIAVIEEEIDLQTKIAAIYKAIMNGWLGIVDDAAVVEEPVEGDEE